MAQKTTRPSTEPCIWTAPASPVAVPLVAAAPELVVEDGAPAVVETLLAAPVVDEAEPPLTASADEVMKAVVPLPLGVTRVLDEKDGTGTGVKVGQCSSVLV